MIKLFKVKGGKNENEKSKIELFFMTAKFSRVKKSASEKYNKNPTFFLFKITYKKVCVF